MLKFVLPPILATLVLAAIAVLSILTQEPLIAPSLGAAAFSQMLHADEKSAAPYNLAVGQLIGAIAGFAGVFLAAQVHAPALIGTHDLPPGRILAVALAAFLAIIGQMAARARTPTGGATALVVALGVESASLAGFLRLTIGIALIMTLGEGARRMILWSRGELL